MAFKFKSKPPPPDDQVHGKFVMRKGINRNAAKTRRYNQHLLNLKLKHITEDL